MDKLERYDESLVLHNKVLDLQLRVLGDQHPDTVFSIFNVATTQYYFRRYDDAHRNASRGLLLARKIGHEEHHANFVKLLSDFEEDEDPTTSVEQKRLRAKIRVRKQQTDDKAVAEAARLATPQPPTTEAALDLLMAEFGLEEEVGKKKSGGGGGNAGGGGGGSKKKKGKGKK